MPHAFEMKLDRLTDQLLCLFQRSSDYTQSGESRGISAATITRFLMDDEILHFKPACLRILFNVPDGTSTDGCPATVSVSTRDADGKCRAAVTRVVNGRP